MPAKVAKFSSCMEAAARAGTRAECKQGANEVSRKSLVCLILFPVKKRTDGAIVSAGRWRAPQGTNFKEPIARSSFQPMEDEPDTRGVECALQDSALRLPIRPSISRTYVPEALPRQPVATPPCARVPETIMSVEVCPSPPCPAAGLSSVFDSAFLASGSKTELGLVLDGTLIFWFQHSS